MAIKFGEVETEAKAPQATPLRFGVSAPVQVVTIAAPRKVSVVSVIDRTVSPPRRIEVEREV